MKYTVALIAVFFASLASAAHAQTYVTGISTSGVQTQTLQFYADQCNPALPNDGVHDDAAPLRACMNAWMPKGTVATMNLDSSKPYVLGSASSSDADWGSNGCNLIVRTGQTLNLNGATLTQTSAQGAAFSEPTCAGSNNQNTPPIGSSGIDNTGYLPIQDTAPGATSITVSNVRCPASGSITSGTNFTYCSGAGTGTNPAKAANINAGDYLYIDCGSNPSDNDVYIGWTQTAAQGNGTTGVIPLAYPLQKPYTHAECPAGVTPRIFDYTTSPEPTTASPGGGPLAQNVEIENGTYQLAPGTSSQGVLFFDGCVHCGADNIKATVTGNAGTQFNFGNNLHLSHFNYDTFQTDGGGGDTFFNVSEFTGSLNTADHDTITLTGVGATGTEYERALGDSEGDESNLFSNDTVTVLAGGSANAGSECAYEYNTWNDSYVNLTCNSQYAGFTDGPVSAANASGPTSIKDSYFYTVQNNALGVYSDNDQIIGNTIITNGAIPIYLQAQAQITHNTITANVNPGSNGLILLSSGITGNTPYYSQISANTFNCQNASGGCSVGININDPGSSIAQPLTITGNEYQNVTTNLEFSGSASTNLPNACINGNGHGVATTC